MNWLHDIWKRFDERTLLNSLPARERAELQNRLLLERAERIATIGWIGIPVAFLLFAIDYSRWRAGTLFESPANVAILLSHVLMLIAGLLALLLRKHQQQHPKDPQLTVQNLHLALTLAGTMANGLFGLADRAEVFAYGSAVAVLNFLYPLRYRTRIMLASFLLGAAVLITFAKMPRGTPEFSLILGEVVAISIFAAVAGGAIYRQLLRAVRSEQILERLANRDGLTEIANRRHAETMLESQLAAIDAERTLTLLIADIDHFKRVNDSAGLAIGDEVLRGFAKLLEESCRSDDLAARWGGDEFVILCRNTDAAGAKRLAERIRLAFSTSKTQGCGRCTASFGIAEARSGDTVESLLQRADTALYAAKHDGRNRTVVAG